MLDVGGNPSPTGQQKGIGIGVTISNTQNVPVSLSGDVLVLRITQVEPAGGVVWRGALPPLKGTMAARGAAELDYWWDERDSSGTLVPLGTYEVVFEEPWTLHYVINGKPDQFVFTYLNSDSGNDFSVTEASR